MAAFLSVTCDSKPDREGPTNPLDPTNPNTGGDPYGLTASFLDGKLSIDWEKIDLPGLRGYTIFRMSEFDTVFARIDTSGPEDTRWIDQSPSYFTTSRYRIAAIGGNGAEADTTGRAVASVTIPPYLEIAGGAATTAVREVDLAVGAARADFMLLSEDSLFEGAVWEPFDTLRSWTLSDGKGEKTIWFRALRGEEDTSETVTASIATASTAGSLVLAGGDSTIVRVKVDVALGGSEMTKLIVSTDTLFGEGGDSTFLFDSLTTLVDFHFDWIFDTDTAVKVLHAQFWNGFGADTTVVDSVWPDDLENVTVLLAGGDSAASECEVSLFIDAGATLMNLSPTLDFDPDGWTVYTPNTTWTIGDTAGTYPVWVQLSNEFVNLRESPAYDDVVFAPVPLGVVIESPADSAEVTDGDTISVSGGVVAASCLAAPDSVALFVGGSLYGSAENGDTSWVVSWIVDEAPEDTLALSLVAFVSDETDSTASDTITVFVLPAK